MKVSLMIDPLLDVLTMSIEKKDQSTDIYNVRCVCARRTLLRFKRVLRKHSVLLFDGEWNVELFITRPWLIAEPCLLLAQLEELEEPVAIIANSIAA